MDDLKARLLAQKNNQRNAIEAAEAITALQAQLAERDDTIRRLMNDLQAHKDALAQANGEPCHD